MSIIEMSYILSVAGAGITVFLLWSFRDQIRKYFRGTRLGDSVALNQWALDCIVKLESSLATEEREIGLFERASDSPDAVAKVKAAVKDQKNLVHALREAVTR